MTTPLQQEGVAEVELGQPPNGHGHHRVKYEGLHGIREVDEPVVFHKDAGQRPREDAEHHDDVHTDGKAAMGDGMDDDLDRAGVLPLLVKVKEARKLEDAPEPLKVRVIREHEHAVARLDRPI